MSHEFTLRFSNSPTWLNCAGAPNLIKSLNLPETTSKYAVEGNVAHKLLEECVVVEGDRAASHISVFYDGRQYAVTEEMSASVQVALDYVDNLYAQKDNRLHLISEHQVSLEYLGVPGLSTGTADLVILTFNRDDHLIEVEVIDYKHGAGVPVQVEGNSQLMMYALGVCRDLPLCTENTPVKITVIQPRIEFGVDGPIRSTTTTAGELFKWEQELQQKALATLVHDARLTPSDVACKWCKAKSQCPARYQLTQQAALVDFKAVDTAMPDVKALTAQQKTFVLQHSKNIASFLKDVSAQVKSEIECGSTEYEGFYKLVRAKTNRQFTSDTSILEQYLQPEKIYKRQIRTLKEIETALKEVLPKKEAIGVMDKATVKPEGGLTIAPNSDPRPTAEVSIKLDFDDVDIE